MQGLIAEELSGLAKLRDEGILSNEEFDERKAMLLAKRPFFTQMHSGVQAAFGCFALVIAIIVVLNVAAAIRGECMPTDDSVLREGAETEA